MSEKEILPDEALSPEDLELRKKGQSMADFIGKYAEHILQAYPLTEDRVREIVRDEINKCQERMMRDLRAQGGTRIR